MMIVTKITTTANDEEVLAHENVKQRLCEALKINEEHYDEKIKSGLKMDCTLLFSASNKVSINNRLANDLIEDSVYTLGEQAIVSSIKIHTPTTATIVIELD